MSLRRKLNLAHTRSHRRLTNPRSLVTMPEDASLIEILDRVLDHGIIIDPSIRMRLIGLDLRELREHLVIDRQETWLSVPSADEN